MKKSSQIKPIPELSESDKARFWAKVDKNGPVPPHRPELGPCWIWTACKIGNGYGIFAMGRRHRFQAHRISLFLARGIQTDRLSCHHCDNPSCVNPAHLIEGTLKWNAQDMVAKGRHSSVVKPESVPSGKRHWSRRCPERYARGEAHGAATKPERIPRGEQRPNAAFSDETVIEIRRRFDSGAARIMDLAAEYGVSRNRIWEVVHRRKYKHLP